jgi:hypothetical protein
MGSGLVTLLAGLRAISGMRGPEKRFASGPGNVSEFIALAIPFSFGKDGSLRVLGMSCQSAYDLGIKQGPQRIVHRLQL